MSISELIGKLHPLVVHLPIGMIALILILRLLHFYRKNETINLLLPLLLKIALCAYILSIVTGYLIPKEGAYNEVLVDRHFYAAIGLGLVLLFLVVGKWSKFHGYAYVLMALLLMVTGHFGGSLTHGENYFGFGEEGVDMQEIPKDGTVFQDVVLPIFHQKCVGCHGSNKSKGKLQLQDFEHLIMGGKSGDIFIAGSAEESTLFKRLILPILDKEHMPPKGKAQLAEREIDIIKWWIQEGKADKALLIESIPKDEPMYGFIKEMVGQSKEIKSSMQLPASSPPSPEVISKLEAYGVKVIGLDKEGKLYKLDLSKARKEAYNFLGDMKANVLDIQANGVIIDAAMCTALSSLAELRTLKLTNVQLAEECAVTIASFQHLEILNFTASHFPANFLADIKLPDALKTIYLYQSNFSVSDYQAIANNHPKVNIDTGAYFLATSEVDSLNQ